VRYTIRWDQVARSRPRSARNPGDAAYDWSSVDLVLRGLRRHGISVLVTLYGTPGWANAGDTTNTAPTNGATFGDFAHAAARRYSWIRSWTIWNEPNQPRWLRGTSARTYVKRLLNPAYAQIHGVLPRASVGGGMTSPRAGASGVSPVAWMRGMRAAGARLDAYAHHPYPGRPQVETPWGPRCSTCSSITMADLERLRRHVRANFGSKRIWLTEYGYQTNPPDDLLGVSPAKQAAYVSSAIRRAHQAPDVDILIFYLVRDDAAAEGWQSGFFTASGKEKPSHAAFRMPLTQVARSGSRVTFWGRISGAAGASSYRIRVTENGRTSWIGGARRTDANGYFRVTITARRGSVVRAWTPGGGYSLAIRSV
jgi:hypothetical protein